MKAAAIYARVSSFEQTKGTSLDVQVASCEAAAAAQGYEVVAIEREDESGTVEHRPKLDKIRSLIVSGAIQALFVHVTDRLSRDPGHVTVFNSLCKQAGVRLISVTDPVEDNDTGDLILFLTAWAGQQERKSIIRRSQENRQQGARLGRVMGGTHGPYGYRYIKGECRLEVVPEEAVVVRQMFNWVAEGMTLYEVATRLNEQGVPTKRGGTYWHDRTVANIIHAEVYHGQAYYNKTTSVIPKKVDPTTGQRSHKKNSKVLKPREEWIPLDVPPIIDRSLWEQAQATVQRHRQYSPRNTKAEYLLRNMLTCGACGHHLGGLVRRGVRVYRCYGQDRDVARDREPCRAPTVRADVVEQQVWADIVTVLSNPRLLMDELAHLNPERAAAQVQDETDLANAQATLSALERERKKLVGLYVKDLLDLNEYQQHRVLLDKREAALATAKAEIETRIAARARVHATEENLQELSQLAQEGLPLMTFAERRQVLELLNVQATLQPDGTVTYSGFIRDQLLAALTQADTGQAPTTSDGLEETSGPAFRTKRATGAGTGRQGTCAARAVGQGRRPVVEPLHLPFARTVVLNLCLPRWVER
jgi:site-specific DNA recombinase